MSFLDKVRAKQAALREQGEKSNPLAATANKETAAPKKEGSSLIERMRASKKARQEAEKQVQEETAAVVEEVKNEEKTMSLQEKAEAIVAEKLRNTEETAKPAEGEKKPEAVEEDTAVKEDTVKKPEEAKPVPEEEQKEEKAEETATVEETETEEKPKKRRRRKSKKEETTSSAEIKVHEFVGNYDILGKKVSFDEMSGAVMDYFLDDEWKDTQDELTKELNDIRIEPDMNPGTLKYALASLNNLNDKIASIFTEQKQLLDSLTDKEFGAATALLAMNSRGANAEERKANGFAALSHAKFGGEEEVNLIALINAVKMRFVFLNSLSKRIQYKSNICITMSSAIKMEQSLITMSGVA